MNKSCNLADYGTVLRCVLCHCKVELHPGQGNFPIHSYSFALSTCTWLTLRLCRWPWWKQAATTLISIPLSCSGPRLLSGRCVWASYISVFKKCLWLLACLHSGSSADPLDASEDCMSPLPLPVSLSSRPDISCCPLCRPLRLYQ